MADIIYNDLFANLAKGTMNLTTSDIRLALVKDSYTPARSHSVWLDVEKYETSGAGYTAGGQPVSGRSVFEDKIDGMVKFSASAVEWPNSSIEARYGVLYDALSKQLVACVDFGVTRQSHGDMFRVDWSASGIIIFGQG